MTDTRAPAALPADIQALLDDVDAADRAAESLASGLTDEQFGWQPDGGRSWSVAQCLEHLATMNVVYGEAVRRGVDEGIRRGWRRTGPLAPGFFGRRFIASMEPPVKPRLVRARAPRNTRPGAGLSRDEILRRYRSAHDGIRRLLVDAAGIDANRATYPNPFLPLVRMRVSTGLRVIAAHDRRHLWQAEQVLRRPGFPRA